MSGVRVRGTCKDGHITETTAAPNRVTWNGPCSHDGCDLPVRARRIPRERIPEPTGEHEHADGTTKVVRVENYDVTSTGAQGDAGGVIVTDAEPEPAPDDEPVSGPADPIADGPGPGGGRLGRLRRRARAERPAGQFRHPLGIPLG